MAELETVAVPPPGEAPAVPSRYATRAAAAPHVRQAPAPAQARRTMSANLSMVAPEDGSAMRPDYMQRWVSPFQGLGPVLCGAFSEVWCPEVSTPCRSVGCCAAVAETYAVPCPWAELGLLDQHCSSRTLYGSQPPAAAGLA